MKKSLTRREALGVLGVSGAALALIRCGGTPTRASPVAEVTTSTPATGTSATCAVSPSETAGPYPSLTDLFRSDIREGKSGLPLTLTITVVNVNNGCSPVAGANVEIIFHGDHTTVRYRAVLHTDASLEEVSAGLLGGGAVGLKSVSWEARKKNL